MVARSNLQISAKIKPYLRDGIDRLIAREPIKDKSLIVNEALDMYLRSKGALDQPEDGAENK